MKYSTAALKEKIRSWFAEPQGKARIACQFFAVLLGLAALLMIVASVAYGSVIGLLVSLLVAPLLVLLPFYFYHFFRTMLQGVADKQIRHRERARQAEEYNNLPFRRTFRGIAFYLTGFILLVTMLMGLLTQSYDIFFELALMLPMMYLMYRGYRWIFVFSPSLFLIPGSVFAILWWTFEKGLQLYVAPGSASIASILVWWAVVTYVYFQAYKVEAVRARLPGAPRKPWLKDLGLALGAFVLLAAALHTLIY